MQIVQRLEALRQLMREQGIDCYLVSSSDPHHNEYVPPCWQWRAFISGFNGSNGHVYVSQTEALLWTDSRYFIEAGQAIAGTPFQLMRIGEDLSLEDYLKQHMQRARIAFDADQWSIDIFERLKQAVKGLNVSWQLLRENLLESLWPERPEIPSTPIMMLDETLTGLAMIEKIRMVQTKMVSEAADYHVLSHLDAIAWVLNIRAHDIPYNPLCLSYLIFSATKVHWFVHAELLSETAQIWMRDHDVLLHPYTAFRSMLHHLSGCVWVDGRKTSVSLVEELKQCTLLNKVSPIDLAKACKNKTEQEGMRLAHQMDGLAMVSFIDWLVREGLYHRETEVVDILESFRKRSPDYRGPSFKTISGFGAHGAIVHYSAEAKNDVEIHDHNLFLLDSGGQYPYGTTDITRVFHLGQPTSEMKAHYTRVLKGHIALSRIIFPEGTKGAALDVLARAALWQVGLDYGHGTGHGVGCYLCVHEGPQGISPKAEEILREGMVLSNEPGYYRAGEYGIRIENLMLVVRHPAWPQFLHFETLTLCPYERHLIDLQLLNAEEMEWINDYHARVHQTLLPLITDEAVLDCLTRFTAPLMR